MTNRSSVVWAFNGVFGSHQVVLFVLQTRLVMKMMLCEPLFYIWELVENVTNPLYALSQNKIKQVN